MQVGGGLLCKYVCLHLCGHVDMCGPVTSGTQTQTLSRPLCCALLHPRTGTHSLVWLDCWGQGEAS